MYEYDPTARMNRGNFRQKVGKGSASYAPMAKPLMATEKPMGNPTMMPPAPGLQDNMATQLGRVQSDGANAPPGQFAGQLAGTTQGESYSGKPDMSGNAQAYAKPLETNPSPAPMPQQGGAGWNDISRYQRPGAANDSGRGGMPGPNIGNPSGVINRLSPGGPETVGGALIDRALGNSRNNQRYSNVARIQRQSGAQQNQLQSLLANGRTMEQALAETGLKGDPMWDESARVSRPRATPRQMAGGGDRYGRTGP